VAIGADLLVVIAAEVDDAATSLRREAPAYCS